MAPSNSVSQRNPRNPPNHIGKLMDVAGVQLMTARKAEVGNSAKIPSIQTQSSALKSARTLIPEIPAEAGGFDNVAFVVLVVGRSLAAI